MSNENFQLPQHQSKEGIVLIFLQLVILYIKRFWPLVFLLFNKEFNVERLINVLIGIGFLLVFGIIYSYFYYQRFTFYIDYSRQRFILQKGVFSSKTLDIPFNKIQQVDIKRSILQRIIGIYSVVIDTAGSKKNEVVIHAVEKEVAVNLSHILTQEVEKEIESKNNEAEETIGNETEWVHHLNFLNLLKIGITESYFRGFLIIFAFVMTIFDYISDFFESYLDEFLETNMDYIEDATQNTVYVVSLILFVLVLSILVTVIGVVIKHFNLSIRKTSQRLEVEMGLKTNSKIAFQPLRLQYLKIITNPIQKRINLYKAQMSLAGTEDELSKNNIIVPGLTQQLVSNILDFLYNKDLDENKRFYKPNIAWLNRRMIVMFAIMSVVWIINHYSEEPYMNLKTFIIGTVLFFALLVPYQYYIYRSISLSVSNDFLKIKSGLWTQKEEIIELYKMQGITIKQPFWYKRRGIYNLTFHTAGGDIKIRAIPKDFDTEINYLLYKIESSREAWM